MNEQDPGAARKSWRHPLAFATALLVLLMICLGATVTTIEAGDSDPSWSWRFWEWFAPAQGGKWYEFMHRRLGTIIGFAGIGLVWSLRRTEPRRWVRRLGYAAVALIVVQGLLGGLRIHVVSNAAVRDPLIGWTGLDAQGLRLAVAMVHAFSAQLVFCLLVVLALVTSSAWLHGELAPAVSAWTGRTRRLAAWTCVLVFVQLLLGAYIRHGRVFYPEERAPYHATVVWIHIAMALGVAGQVFAVNASTRKHHPTVFPVWHLAGLASFLVVLQLFLGFGAWAVTRPGATDVAMPWDVAMLVRTGHVANGAMILAVLVTMTARSWKLLQRPRRSDVREPVPDGREAHA